MPVTEKEFDVLLRRALADNARERQDAALAADVPPPQLSRRYLRWEKKLLADPLGFARRQARPVWKRTLQTAASFLLCVCVLSGAVLALSPPARAWVAERVVYWAEDFTRFRFSGENGTALTEDWRPAYIPEGFVETEAEWNEGTNGLYLTYENKAIQYFIITAFPAEQSFSFNVDNEHSDCYEMEVNGQPAFLFVSNTEGYPSYLIWTSADRSTAFQIAANIDPDQMLQIAENKP